jgi:hypothetical protein
MRPLPLLVRRAPLLLAASLSLAACGAEHAPIALDPLPRSPSEEPRAPSSTSEKLLGASMQIARWDHAASLLSDGRVLVSGGASDGGGLDSAELFDPTTGSWSSTPAMSSGHEQHSATTLVDGRVLVVGGLAAANAVAVDLFSPSTGQWSQGPALSGARVEHSATRLDDGRVLVAGGHDGKASLGSTQLFDPEKKAWIEAGSLHVPRRSHTATLLPDGQVLVTGGASPLDAPNVFPPEKAIAERFDPATTSFTFTAPGLSFRRGHTATLLADGRVLIAGGHTIPLPDATAVEPLATTELYDPASDSWSEAAPMNAPHSGHTATALPSGRVLVLGGEPAPRVVELYNPLTNTWSLIGSLAQGRSRHTATLLAGGQVLIAGGLGDDGPRKSAELVREGLLGEPCASPWECASGYCADGVCCDTGCGGDVVGACRVCSVDRGAIADGTCTTVAGCQAGAAPPPAVSFGVQVCATQDDCGAGTHCVDGVCCDSACTDKCFSCILSSAPGKCTRQPAGFDLRGECGPVGTCISTCGNDVGTCMIATSGTQCRPSECADDGIHGTGPATCPAEGAACPSERASFNCAPYRCVEAFGMCSSFCLTVSDCATPYVCDPTHHCVAPPDTASGSECAAAPGTPIGAGVWTALGALLAGALLRRRRRRIPRWSAPPGPC